LPLCGWQGPLVLCVWLYCSTVYCVQLTQLLYFLCCFESDICQYYSSHWLSSSFD